MKNFPDEKSSKEEVLFNVFTYALNQAYVNLAVAQEVKCKLDCIMASSPEWLIRRDYFEVFLKKFLGELRSLSLYKKEISEKFWDNILDLLGEKEPKLHLLVKDYQIFYKEKFGIIIPVEKIKLPDTEPYLLPASRHSKHGKRKTTSSLIPAPIIPISRQVGINEIIGKLERYYDVSSDTSVKNMEEVFGDRDDKIRSANYFARPSFKKVDSWGYVDSNASAGTIKEFLLSVLYTAVKGKSFSFSGLVVCNGTKVPCGSSAAAVIEGNKLRLVSINFPLRDNFPYPSSRRRMMEMTVY